MTSHGNRSATHGDTRRGARVARSSVAPSTCAPRRRAARSRVTRLLFAGALGAVVWLAPRSMAQQPLSGVEGLVAASAAGSALAQVGDLDGDGVRDVLVGAPADGSVGAEAGAAFVASGADGHLLFQWQGYGAGDQFGSAVACAGDVDADGVDDIVIGAAQDAFNPDTGWAGNGPGYAQVFSGADGSLLFSWQGEAALNPDFSSFGRAVAGVGDLDGDGHDDVAVAEREAEVESLHDLDPVGGRVWVFSGADGSVLRRFENVGIVNGHLGWSMSGGADVDGDGTPDLVMGAPIANRVAIVSGATGATLLLTDGAPTGVGYSVAFLDDVDGDGSLDLVAGAGTTVRVFSGATGLQLHVSGGYPSAGPYTGVAVAACDDIDEDGVGDYAVGAPVASGAAVNGGLVQVFSGATGQSLVVVLGTQPQARLGTALAGVPDADGDGDGDLLLGAPGFDGAAGAGAGFVGVWSTGGPRLVRSVYSPNAADIDFGRRVASVGDVDNDGWGDVAVGLPNDGSVFQSGGRVQVFSGRDGSVLHDVTADDKFYRLGWSVAAAGDVDGDGFADIVAGAPYPTALIGPAYVNVWSGRTGAVLLHYEAVQGDYLGTAVVGPGDVDGDGRPDIAASAPNDNSLGTAIGRVHVVSGASGQLLFDVPGIATASEFGGSLAAAGDVNGDGTPDLIIGARLATTANGAGSGLVRVVSGVDGSTLHDFLGPDAFDNAGWSVAGPGDVDGDGLADVAFGIPGAASPAGGDWGVVQVRSGADGALLATFWSDAGDGSFGHAIAAAGDVDGDGLPDLAVGLSEADDAAGGAGALRFYSVATGELTASWAGPYANDQAGFAVSSAGDVDNDGTVDIVVGAVNSSEHPGLAGGLHVINPAPFDTPWLSLGHTLPGSAGAPLLKGTGSLQAGDTATLALTHARPQTVSALVLGSTALNLPFKGGVLVPDPLLVAFGLPTGLEGEVLISTPWPAGVASGLRLYAQHWITDGAAPKGFAVSNAVVGTTP